MSYKCHFVFLFEKHLQHVGHVIVIHCAINKQQNQFVKIRIKVRLKYLNDIYPFDIVIVFHGALDFFFQIY
jgi:hypothetical protein